MRASAEQVNRLTDRLQDLTPTLVNDLLASYQTAPLLTERYGASMRGVAEQGVVSFRNILLGALEFDVPSVIYHELDWLDRLLQARQVEGDQVGLFLAVFAHRIQTDIPPDDNAPLLALINIAQSRLARP